jgi:hypothetical protein
MRHSSYITLDLSKSSIIVKYLAEIHPSPKGGCFLCVPYKELHPFCV